MSGSRWAWMDYQRLPSDVRLLTTHAWGCERDVDCIALEGSEFPEGSIVFVNGDPNRCVCYQPNLLNWLQALVANARRDRGVLHPRQYAKHGLALDECVAGEVVRAAVEKDWDIFSMEHDHSNDPAELRSLAEKAVASQPRRAPFDPMRPRPIPLPQGPSQPHYVPTSDSETARLLASWQGVELVPEDEQPMSIELRPGAPLRRLAQHEQAIEQELPEQYLDFWATTDGLQLGLHDILSLSRHVILKDHHLIRIVDWGNGDFDCVALEGSGFPHGSIVFCNHNPDVAVQVAESILDWLKRLMEEHQAAHGICHPRDYWVPRHHKGVYAHVCEALKDIDCELNR
jgi:SMI1/KNR4 family protein SUKH-1